MLALQAAVSEIRAYFQNCYIWAWNLASSKSSRSHTYTCTIFLPQWVEIELIFYSTDSGFRDIGRFSKLPYLGMKLGHQPKFQKLHIYPLSTPRGQNWAYFSSTGSGFRDTGQFSKLPYLGMKLGKRPKLQKPHIYPLSTSRGRNWAYFCSTDSGFWDMGRFSKLPYLNIKLGYWPNFQKLHIYFLNYPPSPKFHSVLLCGCPFPRCWQLHFPIGHNVKFQSLKKKKNLKFQNSYQ